MSRIEAINIEAADRDEFERLVRDRNTAQKVVWRARIVLSAAEGPPAGAIAAASGKSQLTVRRWRRRFLAKGVERLLKDASRPPRPQALRLDQVRRRNPGKGRSRETTVGVTTLDNQSPSAAARVVQSFSLCP
jgi:hypothetical protein